MKKNRRNKNVVAPEQKVKSVAELAGDLVQEIGFQPYGHLRSGWQVYERRIAEVNHNFLYVFIKETYLRVYQGFKEDREIRGRRLFSCTVFEIEEVCGLLSEQNYL
jgi:hypothetical protein